jgi:hypothetical protein
MSRLILKTCLNMWWRALLGVKLLIKGDFMATAPQRFIVGYGLTDALPSIFPPPIVANRAPGTTDMAQIGTIWVFPSSNGVWILSSIVANVATWSDVAGAGGAFTTLTVNPGPTNLSTVGNGAVTIGNATNTGAITISTGTGNFALNGNGNIVSIANDAAANSLILGTLTAGGTTLIEGGTGSGVGTAAITLLSGTTGDIQIGSVAHTGAIYLGVSTSGDTVNIASGVNTGAEVVNILNSATGANATVNILSGVGTTGAGVLALGNNGRVTTIGIGNVAPAAARVTTIAGGNSAQNDTVSILNGAPSANTQTFNVLSGTATGGTQALNLGNGIGGALTINMGNGANTTAQTINIANGASGANSTVNLLSGAGSAGTQTFNVLATGATRAGVINLGTGAAAHVLTIGSTTASATTTIQAGGTAAGAITLAAAGNVSVTPGTVSAAADAATLSTQVGVVTLTGRTYASASTTTITITNTIVTAASAILLSVSTLGANDAQLTVTRITPGAGSFTVQVKNNGAASVNGNVIITYWVLAP